eukprot:523542-Prorocentrum_minimum.AAC.3
MRENLASHFLAAGQRPPLAPPWRPRSDPLVTSPQVQTLPQSKRPTGAPLATTRRRPPSDPPVTPPKCRIYLNAKRGHGHTRTQLCGDS